jgi:hypothetical protein
VLEDFYTLKMEAIRSSETSVYTISTRRHIPEDGINLVLLKHAEHVRHRNRGNITLRLRGRFRNDDVGQTRDGMHLSHRNGSYLYA